MSAEGGQLPGGEGVDPDSQIQDLKKRIRSFDMMYARHQQEGKSFEALEFLEKGLFLRKELLGAEHPEVSKVCQVFTTSCNTLAMNALLAGDIDSIITDVSIPLEHLRAGTLRPIGVTSTARAPLLPDVPTAIEQGLPDFEIMNFMGIFVHKATPPAQLARLEAATRAAVANPAIAQKLIEAGTDPVGSSAADFNAFWQAQLALWLPVVEASGVKLE
jgi:hypothetical protein